MLSKKQLKNIELYCKYCHLNSNDELLPKVKFIKVVEHTIVFLIGGIICFIIGVIGCFLQSIVSHILAGIWLSASTILIYSYFIDRNVYWIREDFNNGKRN